MHPGNVPNSGPTTSQVTEVSDVLPDPGLLRVLKSVLPHPISSLPPGLLLPAAASFWTQDGRERSSPVVVLLRDKKSPMLYQISEGGSEIIVKNTSAQRKAGEK